MQALLLYNDDRKKTFKQCFYIVLKSSIIIFKRKTIQKSWGTFCNPKLVTLLRLHAYHFVYLHTSALHKHSPSRNLDQFCKHSYIFDIFVIYGMPWTTTCIHISFFLPIEENIFYKMFYVIFRNIFVEKKANQVKLLNTSGEEREINGAFRSGSAGYNTDYTLLDTAIKK